jgi:hypothetical protein
MIRNGEFIASGECLVSANGRFFAGVDDNGNLHLRLGSTKGFSYWQAAGSQGTGNYAVLLQDDGNICSYVYTPGQPLTGNPVWCTWTQPGTDQYFLILQDDGNLCQYRGTGPTDNRGLAWAAGASFSEGGPYRLYSGTTFGSSVHNPPFVAAAATLRAVSGAPESQVAIPAPPTAVLAEKGAGQAQLWQKLTWAQHGNTVAFALRSLHNGLYLSGKAGYGERVGYVRVPDETSLWIPSDPVDSITKYRPLQVYFDKLFLCVSGTDNYKPGSEIIMAHEDKLRVWTNLYWQVDI